MKQFKQLGKALNYSAMKKIMGGSEIEEIEGDSVPARNCTCAGSSTTFRCACTKSGDECLSSCTNGYGLCVECKL